MRKQISVCVLAGILAIACLVMGQNPDERLVRISFFCDGTCIPPEEASKRWSIWSETKEKLPSGGFAVCQFSHGVARIKESRPITISINRLQYEGDESSGFDWHFETTELAEKETKIRLDILGSSPKGKVISTDATPVANIHVFAELAEESVSVQNVRSIRFSVLAKTDDHGRYALSDLLPGRYLLSVKLAADTIAPDGFYIVDGKKLCPATVTVVQIGTGTEILPDLLVYSVDQPVEFRVTRGGKPLEGMTCSFKMNLGTEKEPYNLLFSSKTNAAGACAFLVPRATSLLSHLAVHADGFGEFRRMRDKSVSPTGENIRISAEFPDKLGRVTCRIPGLEKLPATFRGMSVSWRIKMFPDMSRGWPEESFGTWLHDAPAKGSVTFENVVPGCYTLGLYGRLSPADGGLICADDYVKLDEEYATGDSFLVSAEGATAVELQLKNSDK